MFDRFRCIPANIFFIVRYELHLRIKRSLKGVSLDILRDDSRHSAKDIVIQKQRMEDIHLQLAKRLKFLHMGKQVFYRVISIALCPQEFLEIHRKHLIVFFIPYAVAFDLLVIDSQH